MKSESWTNSSLDHLSPLSQLGWFLEADFSPSFTHHKFWPNTKSLSTDLDNYPQLIT